MRIAPMIDQNWTFFRFEFDELSLAGECAEPFLCVMYPIPGFEASAKIAINGS